MKLKQITIIIIDDDFEELKGISRITISEFIKRSEEKTKESSI